MKNISHSPKKEENKKKKRERESKWAKAMWLSLAVEGDLGRLAAHCLHGIEDLRTFFFIERGILKSHTQYGC